MSDRLNEIRERVKAQPGEQTFHPAYMYNQPYADVTFLLTELERVQAERDELKKDLHHTIVDSAIGLSRYNERVNTEMDRLRAALDQAKEGLSCIAGILSLVGDPQMGEKYAQSKASETLAEIERIESGRGKE